MLSADRLEFGYDRASVIHDLSFTVAEGEILAIMGPNGVGKTTLLKCLNRILVPRAGSVLVGDVDVHSMSRREVARRVGFVAQRIDAPRVTVYDLVLLGRVPRIGWGAGAEDHRVTTEAIELLDLSDLALRYADELSGGELQLAQIARALAQQPRVLFLDEPTSSLDLRNQHRLMATIARIAASTQVAVVMTVHDINLAIRYATRLLLMRDGTVYAVGDRGIVTEEAIEAVYGIDVLVREIDGVPVVVPR
ncbi:MAG: ABC transporter ATP-binding protein [Spirochaetota bacterium]